MAKEFDIFLHRHLTECDLVIQSIPFRDGISVTDRMILDASLQGCRMLRVAAAQSDMEISAKIDKTIKTCYEKLGTPTVMDASVDFKARGMMSLVNEPIEISAENLGTLSTVLAGMETEMIMHASPLVTMIEKSLGRISSQIELDANVADTFKRSLLTIDSDSILNAEVFGDKKAGFLYDTNNELLMDATLTSLCKRIGFDAVAGIELTAMVLGTMLAHSLGQASSGIAIDSEVTGTTAKKLEAASGIIQLMADATPILINLIHPTSSGFVSDADISGSILKRYRLLKETDDLTLSEFDDMMLNEVDYVIFAE